MMAACTVESPELEKEQRAVSFGGYTEQFQTRADAAKEKRVIGDGESMGVYAYLHDNGTWADESPNTPNFMWNQQATYNEELDAFIYSPLKYWPNEENDKVSFIAYYPFTDPASPASTGLTPQLTNDGTGLPSFQFTVNDTPANQVDFLVSDLITNLPKTRDTEDDPHTAFNDLNIYDRVHFIFHHALAKVEFRIVADANIVNDLARFTILSPGITVSNIKKKGTMTATYAPATGTQLSWTPDADEENKHTYTFKTYEPLLLLPQELDDEAQFKVSYEIAFKSDKTTYEYDNLGKPTATNEYVYQKTNATLQLNEMKMTGTNTPLTQWLPNHHYIYTIRLRANRIEFTAQVVEWGEEVTWSGEFVNQ